jgi:hypothetical protein
MPVCYNTPAMTNPEGEHRPVPAPETEAALNREVEQNLRSVVTPERARLIGFAAISRAEILSTSLYTPSQLTEEQVINANANDLPFAAGEMVSEERRRDYWNEGERANLHLAEKHRRWNHKMHRTILKLVATPDEATEQQIQKAELARETLQQLGLSGADTREDKEFSDNNTSQRVSLYTEIEAFRHRFFEQKSDIKNFVQTIAGECRGADSQVDVVKLKDRLDAIKPILTAFGDQSEDFLVEDYAVSYGLLTQRGRAKAVVARETKTKLDSPIRQELKAVYDKLALKQEELEQQGAIRKEEEAVTQGTQKTGIEESKPEEPATLEQPMEKEEKAEFTQAIKNIEEELSEEVGREIKLTPEQKQLVRDKYLHPDAFTNAYYALQELFEEEGKEKSHDEIMQELEKVLRTLKIREDGKRMETVYVSAKGNKRLITCDIYKY